MTDAIECWLSKSLSASPLCWSPVWCSLESDVKAQAETAHAFSVEQLENKPLFSDTPSFLSGQRRHACLRVAMLFQCQSERRKSLTSDKFNSLRIIGYEIKKTQIICFSNFNIILKMNYLLKFAFILQIVDMRSHGFQILIALLVLKNT